MDFPSIQRGIAPLYPRLSLAQRRVADYLLAHTEEIAFLTVERLASVSGVSPATVTRCAVRLGFSGYPALQQAVRAGLRSTLAPPQRLEGQPQDDIFSRSFAMELRTVEQARSANPKALLKQAVQMIIKARRVYVLGMRSSYPVAVHVSSVLHQALGNATLITGTGGFLAEELVPVQPDDLLFAISFPRYARAVLDVIRYTREKGLPVLLLTDSHHSPAAPLADLVLQSPFESSSFFNANTASIAVANAVLAGVALARKRETTTRLQAVEESVHRLKGLLE